jgi:hypothetical protein
MNAIRRKLGLIRNATVPANAAYYIGVPGIRNLGDEAVWLAAKELFNPLTITYDYGEVRRPKWLRGLLSRRRYGCGLLGGGTLIGHHSPVERFSRLIDVSGHGIVFGTGVAPPEEPNSLWLMEWKQALEQCEYVGVPRRIHYGHCRRAGALRD